MKKTYILFLVALFAIVVSCRDESLDPLQFEKIKKGSLLVLRGEALNSIYFNGAPIASVVPLVADGTETFDFDAEFLAEDPTTLASVDVYAQKGTGAGSSRVLLKNVPFSEFKTDDTYPRPWVSISLLFTDIIGKLGLDNTIPLPQATQDALLEGDYKFGINIECDLNLTDGTQVLAADIVSQGLFGSDQFYPAMRLNYPMIGYCPYDPTVWPGVWLSVEAPGTTEDNVITRDPDLTNFPNRFHLDNWWGDGVDVYIDFNPSTDPYTQTIDIPTQTTTEDGVASGTGVYDQCTETITLQARYVIGGNTYDFIYSLSRK
ncbi:MAG: hypothetical protein AABY93_14920 [Bacteroidota bacterium]